MRRSQQRPQGDLADAKHDKQKREHALENPKRPEDECECPVDVVDGERIPCEACAERGHTDAEPTHERPNDCDCPVTGRRPSDDELPCWPCYRDGYDEAAPRTRDGGER